MSSNTPFKTQVYSILRGFTSPLLSDFSQDIRFLRTLNHKDVWIDLAHDGYVDSQGYIQVSSTHPASFHQAHYTLWALSALDRLHTTPHLDVSQMELDDFSFLQGCSALQKLNLGSNTSTQIEILGTCTLLQDLTMSAHLLQGEGIEEAFAMLASLTRLRILVDDTTPAIAFSSLHFIAQLTHFELVSEHPQQFKKAWQSITTHKHSSHIQNLSQEFIQGSDSTQVHTQVQTYMNDPIHQTPRVHRNKLLNPHELQEPSAIPNPSSHTTITKHTHTHRTVCYVCRQPLASQPPHHFYLELCYVCGQFNFKKRSMTAQLSGRIALVTGGRVKIGFETALFLLRSGCKVIVTTRFPRDAARRYADQSDFAQWSHLLVIYGLDLRHPKVVEYFCDQLQNTYQHLDIIINNACQTIRRPPIFYKELIQQELQTSALPPSLEQLIHTVSPAIISPTPTSPITVSPITVPPSTISTTTISPVHTPSPKGISTILTENQSQHDPPHSMSPYTPNSEIDFVHQLTADSTYFARMPTLEEDVNYSEEEFPAHSYDADQQQHDHRSVNSWILELAEISTVEWLETVLINQIAPALLNARLKSALMRSPYPDRYIVNVSAMEGKFYRFKQSTHPHTNMAKAALNMMTRTSAIDYAKNGIYMNSVDTGWVTEELPNHPSYQGIRITKPPLDNIDGAARVVDPIFEGVNHKSYIWGQFLKSYKNTDW